MQQQYKSFADCNLSETYLDGPASSLFLFYFFGL